MYWGPDFYIVSCLRISGGIIMRRRGKGGCTLGLVLIAVGILIILGILLPTGFWWFVLAGILIAIGVCLLRAF